MGEECPGAGPKRGVLIVDWRSSDGPAACLATTDGFSAMTDGDPIIPGNVGGGWKGRLLIRPWRPRFGFGP